MKNSAVFRFVLLFIIFLPFLVPGPCFAFQEHGAREGLYVHELAHICFGSSMLWLFFMIKKSLYWEKKCWKAMALGALILVFWNVMTFLGHILGPRSLYFCDLTPPTNKSLTFWIWYFAKFDTVICCLSMICFYVGLKRLNRTISCSDNKGKGKR